jgi:replication factor C small subunit
MIGYLNAESPYTEDGWFRTGDAVEVDGEYFKIVFNIEKMSNIVDANESYNYVEKIIDPIQSRCQTFAITPPNKTDVAKRLVSVLQENEVEFDLKDIAAIINSSYPDIRRAINAAQASVVNGKLQLDKASAIQANYLTEVLDVLKAAKDKKAAFTKIRQIVADSKVRDFTPMYTFLYDNLDEFATGHIGGAILIIAEAQFKDASVVDKEINIMAMFVNLLNEL